MATPSSLPPPPPQDPIHHQTSPSSTPSSPNSPKPPLQSTSPPKKTPPLPWTHQETINLIRAYQEKWYSLKKGQLKASQWEEVAITVAARCGYDEPSKSATQCRHKIEKLRKRYRTEKLKTHPNSWQYFDLMDRMERGPLPISARPMAMIKYESSDSSDNEDSDGDVNVNYNDDSKKNKSKSINHIVRGEANMNKATVDRKLGGGTNRVLRVLRNPKVQKRKECFESDGDGDGDGDDDDDDEEEEEEEEEAEEEGGGSDVAAEMAAEIRAFAERFVRMENKKIELMRETERYRVEMENKRMEMILESQRKIVDTIGRAFGSSKKMKMAQEI